MLRQIDGGSKMSAASNVKRFEVQDAEWIRKLLRVIAEFRNVHQDITANQMATFLHVALQPHISQAQICDETGLSDATVSRIVALLSNRGLGGRPGADVVSIGMRDDDYRVRGQTLTPKGRRIVAALKAIMTGKEKD
jgi:DNA-binding MarR family transcriptional regulator